MDCNDIENLLADYLGRELDETQRRSFDQHLASCGRCQEHVAQLEQTVSVLQQLDTVSKVDAARHTGDLTVVRRHPAMLRIAVAVMKAAALIALGVGVGWQLGTRDGSTAAPPATGSSAFVADAGFNPKWIELGRHVGGGGSSFARNLAVVAGPHRD